MQQKINVPKGEQITLKGTKYIAILPFKMKVKKVKAKGEQPQPIEPSAEHKTDLPQPIDKNSVVRIIRSEIDRLEIEENEIFMSGASDSDLLDFTEDDSNSLSDHLGTASQIMNLKKILKLVKAL